MSDSIFTKILKGDIPGSFIYRDDIVSAFLDIHGVNLGHCLVVPNLEVSCLADLDQETGKHLFSIGHKIANAYRAGVVDCEGVNLWISDGEVAGQEVPHVHLHVVPRLSNDSFVVDHSPEPWKEDRRGELDSFASKIKKAIEARI